MVRGRQKDINAKRKSPQRRHASSEPDKRHGAGQKRCEKKGVCESAVTPEVAVMDPSRNPITSRSGITEQAAPATQTLFGVPGRQKQAPMPSAATTCENIDATLAPIFAIVGETGPRQASLPQKSTN
jgi:hypothetical protein